MQDEVGIKCQEHAPGCDEPRRARVSRRGLIVKGAAVAAGGVGLAALVADPAHAAIGVMHYGTLNESDSLTTDLHATTAQFATLQVSNSGSGAAVYGAGWNGAGLLTTSQFGVGADLHGSRAPLCLRPAPSTIGAPGSGFHDLGDVFVDQLGRHYLCNAAGTPGTWVRPGLNPIAPYRVCDTRSGTGTPYSTGTKLGPGKNLLIKIAGEAWVPPAPEVPEGATAVVANLTVTGGTATSYLTAYPANIAAPTASNINFVGGQTIANQITVALSTAGDIRIFNKAGSVHVIVDLAGFFF